MRHTRLFTALRHAHTDPADSAAGASGAPGSEPFDAEGAIFDLLDSETSTPQGRRRRAPAAENGDGNDDDPSASHEAGDTDGADDEPQGDPDGEDGADNGDDDPDGSDDVDPELLKARVRVKVGDKSESVTVDELRRGYLRQQDYTRKTTEVAQHRNAMVQATAFVTQQRQHLDQILAAQVETLQSLAPARLSAEELERRYAENPLEWHRIVTAYQHHDKQLADIQQARIDNARTAQQQAAILESERARQEHALLLQRRPEWADPVKGGAARDQMIEYMHQTYGVSPQEFAGAATSHKVLDIVAKAMAYDRAVAASKARGRAPAQRQEPNQNAQQRAPRPAEPGAARSPNAQSRKQQRVVEAQRRVAKTGKVDDAAAAIEQLL